MFICFDSNALIFYLYYGLFLVVTLLEFQKLFYGFTLYESR